MVLLGCTHKNRALETLKAVLELVRVQEWLKTAAAMFLGAVVAVRGLFDPAVFLQGVLGACLVWGGLYALNDLTDWKEDALHPVKRKRPIPSGRISPPQAAAVAVLFLVVGFTIAIRFRHLSEFLAAMCIVQFLYTLPPFRFRDRPVLDILFGASLNPVLRFLAGYTLFSEKIGLSLPVLLFISATQTSAFIIYKSGRKKGSFAVFGKKLQKVAYVLGLLAFVSFIWSCVFGPFPITFLAAPIFSLPFYPFFKEFYKHPDQRKLAEVYRLFYLYLLYITTVLLLLYLLNL